MALLAANQVAISLGPMDWGAVGLASVIIFFILGKKLWRDVKKWIEPRAGPER